MPPTTLYRNLKNPLNYFVLLGHKSAAIFPIFFLNPFPTSWLAVVFHGNTTKLEAGIQLLVRWFFETRAVGFSWEMFKSWRW